MRRNLYYKPFTGLQVFCQKCRSIVTKDSNSYIKCNHPLDRQIYKASLLVPDSGGKRKTKNLTSKVYDEAIKELLIFKNEIEHPEIYLEDNSDDDKPTTLANCVVMFLDYQKDIDVPSHMKKHLDEHHVKSQKSVFKDFLLFIKKKVDSDIKDYKIENINDNIVGLFCDYVEAKEQANATYNGRIKALKALYNYLITEKGYELKNVWNKPRYKPENPVNISISADDFFDLIDEVSPIDSIMEVGKNYKKKMYYYWIKDFFRFKAFTGLRNEDVAELRWNMIHYENNEPVFIESPNSKVNKQKNNIKKEELVYVYVPIGEELKEELLNIGLEDNINSKEHILAPEIKNRITMRNQASKSFTFFWKKLKKPYLRKLSYLRKTYATRERIFNNSNLTTLHSNVRVTEKHYIDFKEIVKQMVKNGFRIFPERETKENKSEISLKVVDL